MTETNNLHLPQFEATDRIHHDDFNDAFQKLDAAVTEKCNMIAGVYTGDGAASRTILLGIKPKAAIVWLNAQIQYAEGYAYGGISVTGHDSSGITLTDNGFTVYNADLLQTNMQGYLFFYLALY